MTLTKFLLARIAEDETCTYCQHPVARHIGAWCRMTTGAIDKEGRELICCCAAVSSDARILAECEAKRRIVELHAPLDMGEFYGEEPGVLVVCEQCGPHEDVSWRGANHPCPTLRTLAAVYADHADYRKEWTP